MREQKILLGTGWKMNKTVREAVDYTRCLLELLTGLSGLERIRIFLVPPFTALEAVKRVSDGKLWVGAQNMHWAEGGAYTGEISAPMLKELGVDLVELGHAERRHYFNETDAAINQKVHTALRYGLRPLVCLGEQPEDKEYGVEKEAVARQLRIAFDGVAKHDISRLIVAYEPVWAIGEEGTPAQPEEVRSMYAHIRGQLENLLGAEGAAAIPVLYGGTVNPDNAAELLVEGHTDGLFIGRAAWQAEGFAELIRACVKATERSVTHLGRTYEKQA